MYRYRRSPSYVFDCKCDRPQKKGRQESPSVRLEKQKVLSCINHCTSLYQGFVKSSRQFQSHTSTIFHQPIQDLIQWVPALQLKCLDPVSQGVSDICFVLCHRIDGIGQQIFQELLACLVLLVPWSLQQSESLETFPLGGSTPIEASVQVMFQLS